MRLLTYFLSGFLFAIGLGISGMTNPNKVSGFLNLAGNWDPSLLMVMAGAVTTYFSGFMIISKRTKPVFEEKFLIPDRRDFDRNLLIGSALFGLGWGLVGFCPGPALVSLVSGHSAVVQFVLAMGIGMFGFDTISRRLSSNRLPSTAEKK